jgi:DNA-binding CsgD family transcriptional regulator
VRHQSQDTLVHTLYDAALEPALTTHALGQVTRSLEAETAIFLQVHLRTRELGFLSTVGLSESVWDMIVQRQPDPAVKASMGLPQGTVFRCEEVLDQKALVRTEFWQEISEPCGLHHFVGAFLELDAGWFAAVGFHRTRSLGTYEADQCKRLECLVPHLQRFAQTRSRLSEVDMQRAAAFEALEVAPTPTVLVDARLKVIFANAGARTILARRDGLTIARDGLCAASPGITSDLRARLVAAASTGAGRGTGSGGKLVLPRPSGARSLLATIVPLRGHGLALGARRPAAALFLAECEAPQLQDGFAAVFGLTPAEAKVAHLVASGRGLAHVARELGISANTVKTHLAHVLQKTGTNRQAELAALLQHLAAQLPRPAGTEPAPAAEVPPVPPAEPATPPKV